MGTAGNAHILRDYTNCLKWRGEDAENKLMTHVSKELYKQFHMSQIRFNSCYDVVELMQHDCRMRIGNFVPGLDDDLTVNDVCKQSCGRRLLKEQEELLPVAV